MLEENCKNISLESSEKILDFKNLEDHSGMFRKSSSAEGLKNISPHWGKMHTKLAIFKEKYGHCVVKKEQHENLSAWVSAQRVSRRKGKLPKKQIGLLDKLGFIWDYQSTKAEATWDKHFKELKEYKVKNGNCYVPRTYHDSKLASWVWIQRQRYRGNISRERKITKQQIKCLEDIGFSWDPRNSQWLEKFNKLKDFLPQNGSSIKLDTAEAKKIYIWFQRQKKAMEQNKLSTEKAELLKNYQNISLQNKADIKWQKRYAQLKKYKEEFGDCKVPYIWEGNPLLSYWVVAQRQHKRQEKLDELRETELNEIGFSWKLRKKLDK